MIIDFCIYLVIYLIGSIIALIIARKLNERIDKGDAWYTFEKDVPLVIFLSWLSVLILGLGFILSKINIFYKILVNWIDYK